MPDATPPGGGSIAPRRFVGPLDALRIRPFAAFFVASSASSIGTWIQRTVSMVVIYDLTDSALAVGLLAAASTLPILLFSLVAGYASDRFERRHVIVSSHLVSAGASFGLAAVTAVAGPSEVALLLVAWILATSWAFAKPALSAWFPSLVPDEAVRAATAANSLTFIVGQVLGPIVGTAIILSGELAIGFTVNGITFLLPAVVVARTRPRDAVGRVPPRVAFNRASLVAVLTRPNIALLAIIALSAGAADVLRNLAPVVVGALGSSAELTGAVLALISIGSGIGAVTVGHIARATGHRVSVILGLLLEGGSLLAAALWLRSEVVLVASLLTGIGYSWTFIALTGELQARTPTELKGRAMSMHALAHLGMRPVNTLATSAVAAGLGVAAALAANGLLALGILALVGASFRGTRSQERDSETDDELGRAEGD